jgi:hypothetical protein
MSDWMFNALVVTLVIVYAAAWCGVLVGAVSAWAESERGWGIGLALAWLVLTVAPITAFVTNAQHEQHGSCKYEHLVGKGSVCDEYYPLPQVTQSR